MGATDKQLRTWKDPPRAYLDHSFGGSNVYYGPAVMYHDLRKMVGDAKFFAMVRGWPAANDNATADREEFVAYMEKSHRRGADHVLRRLAPWQEDARPRRRLPITRRLAKGATRLPVRMRLLVLGGSVFLSKAVAQEAVRRGHEVTCACRGTSGSVPEGVRHVTWDRDLPVPAELWAGFDAVVDVARHPSRVRAAVAAFPEAHWVFVSSISVYSDEATPGGRPDTLPLHQPIFTDEDPMSGADVYGAMKVGCEQAVQQAASSATVVRPGLIVGPGDPSGRYTYWPWRLSEAGERVLAPGSPDDLVQIIDVRDLASWLVRCAEGRHQGVYDAIGPATRLADVLTATAAGVGCSPELVWVDQEFLLERERSAVERRPVGAAVAPAPRLRRDDEP